MEKIMLPGLEKGLAPVAVGTAIPELNEPMNPFAPPPDRTEEFHLLDELWDMGLTTYDCAAHYGEPGIGEYLKSRGRTQEAVIITKCAHPNSYRNRVTPYDMESDLHDSLARLKADIIDVYLLHRDDTSVPVAAVVETMNRFIKEGLIRVYGASNWTAERIGEANRYAEEHGLVPMVIGSPNYSLAHQVCDPWGGGCTTLTGAENALSRKWYLDHSMPVLAYSALGRGFFSGKFRSDEPEKAEEVLDMFAKKGYYYPENMERLKRAETLAEKYSCPVSVIALSWLFHQELTVIPVISGRKTRYYTQALQALNLPLTREEISWLDLQEA